MKRRTDNFVLQSLIFSESSSIPMSFMFLSSKILDSLIIEEAVCMNTTRDLETRNQPTNIYIGARKSHDIALIHLASDLGPPLRKYDTCGHYFEIISICRWRQKCQNDTLTIGKHDEEDNECQCPLKQDTKCHQCHGNINKGWNDVE